MTNTCRFCKASLHATFCDLGLSPLSNAYLSENQLTAHEPFYPLHAFVCTSCLLVQLPNLHTPSEIFEEYAYFSSYSSSWLEHAKAFAQMAQKRFHLSPASHVVEVASNDGYLLQYFKELDIPVLGIEPAKNVAKVAQGKGIPTLSHFFGSHFAKQVTPKADLLIGNNVLAHVPDLNDFVAGLKIALNTHGVISMEFPHLLRLIEENQFDTIYHEHFSYFSLLVVCRVFAAHGLTLFDVQELATHGGSLRIFAKHTDDATHPIEPSIEKLIALEKEYGLDRLKTYTDFPQRVTRVKTDFLQFLQEVTQQNKKVMGYGAPAKGNTLLNTCRLSPELLPMTVDRNRYKQGKFLPGTHIPIYTPEKIREIKPDYLVILPWNLKKEIMQETGFIREWGGQFVIPIPHLEVVS